jgi:hypothetical protein
MCVTQIFLKANRLFHLIVLMKGTDKKFLGKPTYRITLEDCRIADTICAIEMVSCISVQIKSRKSTEFLTESKPYYLHAKISLQS